MTTRLCFSSGELDWEASHELVSTIETVADHYFYTELELLIASPGGNSGAFQYYLAQMARTCIYGHLEERDAVDPAASHLEMDG